MKAKPPIKEKTLLEIIDSDAYQARPTMEAVHKEFLEKIPRKQGANCYANEFLKSSVILRDYKTFVLQDAVNALRGFDIPVADIKYLFGIYCQLLVDTGYAKAIDSILYEETIFQNI